MLVFAVPLKSPQVAKSWEYVSRLFERCLRSVCAQTSTDFKVIVVCHERPAIGFDHPAVSYIQVDWPAPAPHVEALKADKARKLKIAVAAARDFSPTHIMAVDADDCISNRLAEFVRQHPEHLGWYFDAGYLHRDGGRRIHLMRREFYYWCSTCLITRFDWVGRSPAPDGGEPIVSSGSSSLSQLRRRGVALEPLPFPGAIYVDTKFGEGTWARKTLLWHLRHYPAGALRRPWKLFVHWFLSAPLTPALAAEFGLYAIEERWPISGGAGKSAAATPRDTTSRSG